MIPLSRLHADALADPGYYVVMGNFGLVAFSDWDHLCSSHHLEPVVRSRFGSLATPRLISFSLGHLPSLEWHWFHIFRGT